jgi:CRISPR/Cas system endoribonuclease Cas6 (RAMP superfamily)
MRVESQEKLPQYQVIGKTLRIHWEYTSVDATLDKDFTWSMQEAVVTLPTSRSKIIEAIIGSNYSISQELAAINNGGYDYEKYQSFRSFAKSLADGYLDKK